MYGLYTKLPKRVELSEPQCLKECEKFRPVQSTVNTPKRSGAHELWGRGIGSLHALEMLGLRQELGLILLGFPRRGGMPGQHPGTASGGGSYRRGDGCHDPNRPGWLGIEKGCCPTWTTGVAVSGSRHGGRGQVTGSWRAALPRHASRTLGGRSTGLRICQPLGLRALFPGTPPALGTICLGLTL